ncbi:geranylgeranylglycerol-phosphate geranylgeranyltransferase [Lutibacter sp.]|uniref:geranylgeranylglycerol-phosphate geranylgeranyltransferase n=1 Tax=Lutibacter sp. TaxID=1925666 RepID=UPI0025C48B10|nr:geranylgeranylglycerol-phosphate geranylgeranyltransferase [Lutibacter sp.]MCF6167040.1 geranylgeranylglycerol-phosphate geranylgeranyltransferase [Lutibacter sp.]
MKFTAFFKLLRWKNLLLMLYTQLLLKLLVFNFFNIDTNLSLIQFIVLIISILLITAAGYVINDIYDIKTDLINKPSKVIISKYFSVEQAKLLYLILNTFGIILGVGLSLNVENPTYSFIFIGASLLLYYYAKKLKPKPLIGNIIVSFLVACSILILVVFDINQSIQTKTQQLISNTILMLSLFAFFLTIIRELIKDIEDVNGDYSLNMRTLPILIGKRRTKKIALILCIIPISLLLYIILNYAAIYQFTVLYLLLFTFIPLLYVALKLFYATSIKDYKKVSLTLKIIMFLGINSLIFFSINT